MSLPGVGEVLANRIIEGRSDGPYQAPKDLLRVRGISPKTLQVMTPGLLFTKISGGGKTQNP
jgi:DNA uptake protein ComE-like DNA-binding protein